MIDKIGSVILAFLFGAGVCSVAWRVRFDESHKHLGSKGGPCFANLTCRENLRCLQADGISPVCVK